MIKIRIFIFLIILTNFLCCKKREHVSQDSTIENVKFLKREKERIEKRKIILEIEKSDSINFEKILEKSLNIANKHINDISFKVELKPFSDNNLGSVSTKMVINNLFSKKQKHLLIKTETNTNVYINIFILKNNSFVPVLSHIENNMTFVKDTIQDVNGDGKNDFLVNWYGSSGCCLKNFYDVYLYQTDKIEFSKGFNFINPTFSPREKIIRGVCYGHPGETEMYKYKWNKVSIDTIEYISYETNLKGIKTGKIIKSKKIIYQNPNSKYKKLNNIPEEYKSIYGYDWFIGNP